MKASLQTGQISSNPPLVPPSLCAANLPEARLTQQGMKIFLSGPVPALGGGDDSEGASFCTEWSSLGASQSSAVWGRGSPLNSSGLQGGQVDDRGSMSRDMSNKSGVSFVGSRSKRPRQGTMTSFFARPAASKRRIDEAEAKSVNIMYSEKVESDSYQRMGEGSEGGRGETGTKDGTRLLHSDDGARRQVDAWSQILQMKKGPANA